MVCEIEGCPRDVNRDGVCLTHKLKSVNFTGLERMRRNREDNTTQAEIKQEIFDAAREDGVDIKQKNVTSPTSGPLL